MYFWIGKLTANRQRLNRAGRILRLMPAPLALWLCYLMGSLLFLCAAPARRLVLQNMSVIMKEKPLGFIVRCGSQYFTNIFITIYELLTAPWLLGKEPGRRFAAEGESRLQEALSHGRGAILFAPHLGNFFYYYWLLSQKYSCLTVATAGSPELRPLYLIFRELGCAGLDYDETPPRQLLRTLRAHLTKNGVVLLLGDFFRPSFPAAELLGKSSRSPVGTAALALENHVPVVPFFGYRSRGFRHRLVFEAPVLLHEKYRRSQRAEATNALNRYLDRAILEAPGQWFYWFNLHQRWTEEHPAAGGRTGGAGTD